MLVCRQHGREPVFPHHGHGEAVRETISLVGPGLVKGEASGKDLLVCGSTRTEGFFNMASTVSIAARRTRVPFPAKAFKYSTRTASVVRS